MPLKFLEIAFGSLFPFPCLSLSTLSRRRCRAPPARRSGPPSRPTPTSPLLHAGTHASPRSRPTALLPRAGASPAVPRTHAASRAAQAAATATPPWSDRCSTPGSPLARAPASGEPLHSIPHALSPIPPSDAPEHRRRSAKRRRAHSRRRTPSSTLPLPQSTPPVALP